MVEFMISRPRDELLAWLRQNLDTLSARLIAEGVPYEGRPEEYICPRWRMDNYDSFDLEIDGVPLEKWHVTIYQDDDAAKFVAAFPDARVVKPPPDA
jgi:hypothetical protein